MIPQASGATERMQRRVDVVLGIGRRGRRPGKCMSILTSIRIGLLWEMEQGRGGLRITTTDSGHVSKQR
jgi:hypothetical protein